MSEEEFEDELELADRASRKKKRLILIAASTIVGVIILGVVVLMIMLSSGAEKEVVKELPEGEEEFIPGAVLKLDPIIVNLKVKGSFIKSTIELEFQEKELPPTMESEIPKIRDAIIMATSDRTAQELLTNEGKDELADDIIDTLREILKDAVVEEVFFTNYVIQ